MPLYIYKSNRYAINIVTAKQYLEGGIGSFSFVFPKMSASFASEVSTLSVPLKAFSANFNQSYSLLDINIPAISVSFNQLSGDSGILSAVFKPLSVKLDGKVIAVGANSFMSSMLGQITQQPNISFNTNAVVSSMSGEIAGNVTIIIQDSEEATSDTYPELFTGNLYLVVNLRTKTHTTYRDGTNNALAETGLLELGGLWKKNISDIYVSSRSTKDMELIITTEEELERVYPIRWKETTEPSLKNKKVQLAKGLKAAKWKVALLSKDDNFSEVNGIDMIVHKTKRRA